MNILEQLQERAKELQVLYKVNELVRRRDVSPAQLCSEVTEILPAGMRHPGAAWGRVVLEGVVCEPPGAAPTAWGLTADILLQGEKAGSVEVYYTREMPPADEGPFLMEERRLLEAIAARLALFLARHRGLAPEAGEAPGAPHPHPSREREWWAIVDFLRRTDQHLLVRLARRMLNYLCWSGITDAQDLLQRFSADGSARGTAAKDNIPLRRKSVAELLALTDATFETAAAHLAEGEIVSCIQNWMKDDRSGFLVEALENPCTSLHDIGLALERHNQLALQDGELSRAVQIGLRVSLARRFFTDDLDFLNTAKNYIGIADFYDLVHHIISPSGSHGKLGGKSSGMLLASQILRKVEDPHRDLVGEVRVPKTWFIASDGLQSFAEHNQLEDVYNRKYLEIDQVRREYPHIVQVFKNSSFAPEILAGLSAALDDLEGRPLIVRSSSLLEDRIGASFSGKYKSLFLANVGTRTERLGAMTDAIAEVYASLFAPDPIEYRAERNLLDLHEEMGIMIQEVVGSRVGPYFMPSFAGVAFSHNEFRWSPRIRREDGLVRLVPGLGTGAVDRVGDDYPVLVAPGQSGLRVNVTTNEVLRYAPRRADAINLETRQFETVQMADLLRAHGAEYPALRNVVSVLDRDRMLRPLGFDSDLAESTPVVTFEGLISSTPFLPRMRAILTVLREKMGVPVDIEFACDGSDFYLLQCRPQSFARDSAAAPIPAVSPEHLLFAADKYVSNGRVPDVTHVVYVDPDGYNRLSRLEDLRDVGRAVGRLNKLLPRRQFVLMGPGRWGSRGDIKLGVSVTYSDINNAAVLIEIAARRGNSVPDLSFGTHFFQDLVEAGIRYLPLFPDEEGQALNDGFLRGAHNALADLLPEYRHLAPVVHVVDVAQATGGLILRVLMNADEERAVGMFAPPAYGQPAERRTASEAPPVTDDHWRWRLRMAERIAEQVDAARYGVRGMYVFGSTKNATAGPESDINLIVHVSDGAAGRKELEAWLEGWSQCLSEMNYVRTGRRTARLLDVHVVTDDDVARQAGAAAKINAVRDPARPLRVGTTS